MSFLSFISSQGIAKLKSCSLLFGILSEDKNYILYEHFNLLTSTTSSPPHPAHTFLLEYSSLFINVIVVNEAKIRACLYVPCRRVTVSPETSVSIMRKLSIMKDRNIDPPVLTHALYGSISNSNDDNQPFPLFSLD